MLGVPKQPLPSNKSAVLATWALLGGPAILARGVKSACFAAARGGHPRLAAACHAASARSRACGARPDVENTQHGTFTASVRARKSQIPSKIGNFSTWTVAADAVERIVSMRVFQSGRRQWAKPCDEIKRPSMFVSKRGATDGSQWISLEALLRVRRFFLFRRG